MLRQSNLHVCPLCVLSFFFLCIKTFLTTLMYLFTLCIFVYISFSRQQMAPQHICSPQERHLRPLQLLSRQERMLQHRLLFKLGALHMLRPHR